MKSEERIAAIRVFYDLIMADTVIDSGEMDYYQILKDELHFSTDEEKLARNLSFADALKILQYSDAEVKKSIIDHCYDLSVSDGFCARSEAILIASIVDSLSAETHHISEVISVPRHLFNIPNSCVIYIESQADETIDTIIAENYRFLFSEFRLAGFEYIYIPHVIKHYQESSRQLVEQIVSFISPGLTPDGLDATIDKLLSMNTIEFTKDILCNKLGMSMLRNTAPALLFKIGYSYVGDMVYSNYLKVELGSDCIERTMGMLDKFTSMMSTDVLVISNNKEHKNQFLYSGFYKLLLDTHLLRRNVRTRIFINPYKEEIYFPDIDSVLLGLHRREKALYLLLLIKSMDGGINFTPPSTGTQLVRHNIRMQQLQSLYGKIYNMFGGETSKSPDLSLPELRRPMISLIKRQLKKYSSEIYNISDYLIEKEKNGSLHIGIEPEMVFIRDYSDGSMVDLRTWGNNLRLQHCKQ